MTAPAGSPNGWEEWSKYVLKSIDHLRTDIKELDTKTTQLLTDVASLKVKAGVWGLLGGCIPAGIAAVLWLLSRGKWGS